MAPVRAPLLLDADEEPPSLVPVVMGIKHLLRVLHAAIPGENPTEPFRGRNSRRHGYHGGGFSRGLLHLPSDCRTGYRTDASSKGVK